jgi:hypothetical protein
MSVKTQWKQDRPVMPGYGVPEDGSGMLAWDEVSKRLAGAKTYWVGTASASGQPHAVPVWAAWIDDTLYIGAGGPRTNRNLKQNPRVSVHLESGSEVVILEGAVESGIAIDPVTAKAIDDQYGEKYDYRPSSESEDGGIGDGWYVLKPSKVIAWTSFPADATRWTNVNGKTK